MTTAANWFEVDKVGLAKIQERRGKEYILYELIQNSWDTEAKKITVTLEPLAETRTRAALTIEDDDPDGFKDLRHAFTLFAESEKKGDPEKRGRFNLGEKLVLALCEEALIASTRGAVVFNRRGRETKRSQKRKAGSKFSAIVRMTKKEIDEVLVAARLLIPPPGSQTLINGKLLGRPVPIQSFECSLPTEIADKEGILRRTVRKTTVEVFEPHGAGEPQVYEMGIPVVETGDKYHYNVLQKVPLNADRDNVTPAYLRLLRTEVLNRVHEHLTKDDASEGWVRDAAGDERADQEAVEKVMDLRFGEKRVIFDPSDTEGSKKAMAQGYTVIPPRALSKDEWENVRKHEAALPAGKVTPSSKVLESSDGTDDEVPREKWNKNMAQIVTYAEALGPKLLDTEISVRIVSRFRENHAAWFGGSRLTFNLARLGYAWFNEAIREEVDSLIIHEFGHFFESDHLSEKFHDALCTLGAKLTALALSDPGFFQKHGRK